MAADCQSKKKALTLERNLKKERQMLEVLILECPDDPVVNYKYAWTLERFRKYNKSLSYYKKAVLLNPRMGKAYVGMGDIYMYRGALDDAIDAYKIAVELVPEDRRANRRLVHLEIKRNALEGLVVDRADVIEVMGSRGKISSNMPLLLTGPVLQYRIAFVNNSSELLPTGIGQLAAIGQAMQSDSLKNARFEMSTHVDSVYEDSLQALEESKIRAEMIKDQLVSNFLINPDRIDIVWYGDSMPLEAGRYTGTRSLNSRVEFKRLPE